ncbi:MAG: cupin domain-containing protein, partial [Planctomycetota bacterium]
MPDYKIHLDVKYKHLDLIDVPADIAANTEPWFNQTLTQANDSVVRLGIIHGDFHWHKHDNDDEFFFVLQGRLYIDVRDEHGNERTIEMGPHQGVTIPKGVM